MTLQELADRSGVSYATVHREIGRLIEASLVTENRVGNARLVTTSSASPSHSSLSDLLETAFGPAPLFTEALRSVEGVRGAAIFGSYADRAKGVRGDDPEDIDVVVVGDEVDIGAVYAACAAVTETVRREVRPVLATTGHWWAAVRSAARLVRRPRSSRLVNPFPLTNVQTAKLAELVRQRKPRPASVDRTKAPNFIDQATEAASELGGIGSAKVRYDVVYNIANDVGEAVLSAYGFRTGDGKGQHQEIGEALRIIFDTPPESVAATGYDRFRLDRNGVRSRAAQVSPEKGVSI